MEYQESKLRQPQSNEKSSLIQDAIKYHLPALAYETGISADELAENLQNDQKPTKSVNNHVPKMQEIGPAQAVEIYVNEESRFLCDSYKALENLCLFMANEIFYHPDIRYNKYY